MTVTRSRSIRQGVVFGVTVALAVLLTSGPAVAGVGMSQSMTVPIATAVGQDNAGSVTVINTNTPPNQAEFNNVTQLRITPSCGVLGTTANPCPTPDPGVFSVLSATGMAGTACAGLTFTPSAPDASGSVILTPSGAVSLAPPGGAAGTDRCTVNFTFRTLKMPSLDSNPGAAGVQTRFSFRGQLQGAISGLTVAAFSSVEITVVRATPTITTQASPTSMGLGGSVSDTATITFPVGATVPTGTVQFSLYGPNDATCAGAPAFQSTNTVSPATATTATATSSSFTPAATGTYRYVASYSGDVNYNPLTSPCNAANETVTVTPASPDEPPVADFDGNNTTDVSVFRPGNNTWYLRTTSPTAVVWGAAGDIPVPGDYDGNGTTDVAVFRPSNNTWYLRTTSPTAVVWGQAGDIPVPGDYDGNGTTDVAVFRPSNGTWYLRTAVPAAIVWGQNGDVPVPGDYDGNGTTDLAVFRPSNNTWYLRTAAPVAVVWGQAGDIPVPGDYDGNGTTDIAVFRETTGTWYLRTAAPMAIVWGQNGDVPVPGDYDGNGTTDLAVFRPSNNTWYLRTAAPLAVVWGAAGDIPVPIPQAIYRAYFP